MKLKDVMPPGMTPYSWWALWIYIYMYALPIPPCGPPPGIWILVVE